MPITLNDLKSLLESDTATIFTDQQNTLLYPFCYRGQMLQVFTEIMEGGKYVRFYIPWLLDLSRVQALEKVLVNLLYLNRRLKMLSFGYDPADGEVSVSIEIPLQDGTLTERQAHRCMYALTKVATRERDNLLALIRTGVYPGSSDPEFTDTVDRLLGPEQDEALETEADSSDSTADR